MVPAHGAHRHPGVRGQLANRQHETHSVTAGSGAADGSRRRELAHPPADQGVRGHAQEADEDHEGADGQRGPGQQQGHRRQADRRRHHAEALTRLSTRPRTRSATRSVKKTRKIGDSSPPPMPDQSGPGGDQPEALQGGEPGHAESLQQQAGDVDQAPGPRSEHAVEDRADDRAGRERRHGVAQPVGLAELLEVRRQQHGDQRRGEQGAAEGDHHHGPQRRAPHRPWRFRRAVVDRSRDPPRTAPAA